MWTSEREEWMGRFVSYSAPHPPTHTYTHAVRHVIIPSQYVQRIIPRCASIYTKLPYPHLSGSKQETHVLRVFPQLDSTLQRPSIVPFYTHPRFLVKYLAAPLKIYFAAEKTQFDHTPRSTITFCQTRQNLPTIVFSGRIT
jgi:hypothetical protein